MFLWSVTYSRPGLGPTGVDLTSCRHFSDKVPSSTSIHDSPPYPVEKDPLC